MNLNSILNWRNGQWWRYDSESEIVSFPGSGSKGGSFWNTSMINSKKEKTLFGLNISNSKGQFSIGTWYHQILVFLAILLLWNTFLYNARHQFSTLIFCISVGWFTPANQLHISTLGRLPWLVGQWKCQKLEKCFYSLRPFSRPLCSNFKSLTHFKEGGWVFFSFESN